MVDLKVHLNLKIHLDITSNRVLSDVRGRSALYQLLFIRKGNLTSLTTTCWLFGISHIPVLIVENPEKTSNMPQAMSLTNFNA